MVSVSYIIQYSAVRLYSKTCFDFVDEVKEYQTNTAEISLNFKEVCMTKGAENDASIVMDTGWTRSCSTLLQLRIFILLTSHSTLRRVQMSVKSVDMQV